VGDMGNGIFIVMYNLNIGAVVSISIIPLSSYPPLDSLFLRLIALTSGTTPGNASGTTDNTPSVFSAGGSISIFEILLPAEASLIIAIFAWDG
jgi:hypothetical protein